MPTVAITGATGFVGGHLLTAFAGQARVRALARRPQPEREGVEWIPGALEDPESLRRLVGGVDAVIHAGALIKARNRAEFHAANAAGTDALAEAVASVAGERARLIYISSLAARQPQLSTYGATKLAGEEALVRHLPPERRLIVRAPAVYGPGDGEILKLLSIARRGLLPAPGSVHNRVSMMYGPDLAALLAALALEEDGMGGATLEPDDETPGGYDYRALAGYLSEILGRPVRPLAIPSPLFYGAALASELRSRLTGRATILTREKAREVMHPDWVSRPEARPKLPGPPTDITAGLAETVAWARRQGLL